MGFHQKNKTHKTGKHISKRSNVSYETQQKRKGLKQIASGQGSLNKHGRRQQLENIRKASKENISNSQRKIKSAPLVVGCLPLSSSVDTFKYLDQLKQFLSQESFTPSATNGMDTSQDNDIRTQISQIQAKFGMKSISLTFLPPAKSFDLVGLANMLRTIDVLLLVNGTQPIQEKQSDYEKALKNIQIIKSFGTPHIIGIGLSKGELTQKEKQQIKGNIKTFCDNHISKDISIFISNDEEGQRQLLRHLIEHPIKIPIWKQQRPFLLAQNAYLNQNNQQDINSLEQNISQICLEGYVRYVGLSVDNLVTIPGYGDYQLDRIEVLDKNRNSKDWQILRTLTPSCEREQLIRENNEVNMELENDDKSIYSQNTNLTKKALLKKVPKGTSAYQASWFLDGKKHDEDSDDNSDNNDDDMLSNSELDYKNDSLSQEDSDQELELIQLDEKGNAIQSNGTLSQSKHESMAMQQNITQQNEEKAKTINMQPDSFGGLETSSAQFNGAKSIVDTEMDYADMDYQDYVKEVEAKKQQQKEQRKQEQDLGEELEYPDEVDTPLDIPARIRFQKYRGLKSLRTSQWDSNDNQPAEYQKVFAFENFSRAKKRALKQSIQFEDTEHTVAPNHYVRIFISEKDQVLANEIIKQVQITNKQASNQIHQNGNIDLEHKQDISKTIAQQEPVSLFGLMSYESRLSVINIGLTRTKDVKELTDPKQIVKKNQNSDDVIKSKDELIFVGGIRTFKAKPIFSEDTVNWDKFKMERFMMHGRYYVASVYAPITYNPMPVLVFRELQNDNGNAQENQFQLVAAGGIKSCDPNRIILKRILLSGYPFKVHKRKATVRYMFHTPEDVRWFKPLELWTKNGRRGRITEPLGTHGYMKCEFDGHLQSGDTVYLTLYKRVFPKWPQDQKFN